MMAKRVAEAPKRRTIRARATSARMRLTWRSFMPTMPFWPTAPRLTPASSFRFARHMLTPIGAELPLIRLDGIDEYLQPVRGRRRSQIWGLFDIILRKQRRQHRPYKRTRPRTSAPSGDHNPALPHCYEPLSPYRFRLRRNASAPPSNKSTTISTMSVLSIEP